MSSPESEPAAPHADLDDSQVIAALAGYARVLEQGDSRERAAWKQRLANLPPAAASARGSLEQLHAAASAIRAEASGAFAAWHDWSHGEPTPAQLGDFCLLHQIGQGGMGFVYEAEQTSLGRHVAVKVLPAAAALDGTRQARFRQEAQAAAALRHPHIVPVFAVGIEQGTHYYAMQLIAGRSLAHVLEELREQSLTPSSDLPDNVRAPAWFDTVASYGLQAAEALHHAHELGIVHRDIKPANLLVNEEGHLYVADFGLASIADAPELTGTGDLLGTLRYSSPEQALGLRAQVDHRADVYSLGATLYELLTLAPVRQGETRAELLKALAGADPPPPRSRNPAIPADLETIVLKAIESEREDRYASAAAFAQDLKQYLSGGAIQARRAGPFDRIARLLRRHPRMATVLVSVLSVSLVLLSTMMMLLNDARRDARQQQFAAQQLESQVRQQRDAALQREQVLRRFRYVGDMQRAHAQIERGLCGDADAPLDAHVPRAGEADERDFAWHYLHALRHQDSGQLIGHDGDVYFVDFSPDGSRLASASKDGTVRVWDYESGKLSQVLKGHTSEVNCVQYTPDGNVLISTGDDNNVRLWDAASGEPLATLAVHQAPVVGVSVHRGGQFMATVDDDGWILVWDVATRAVVERQYAHPNCRIEAVEFSPDGQLMATCGGDGVRVWDARQIPQIKLLHLLEGHLRSVLCLAWSPDSQYLTAGSGDTARVWEASSGRQSARLFATGDWLDSVCFSPDGEQIAAGNRNGLVSLWDPKSGRRLVNLHGHTNRLWCIRYAPDGHSLATSSADMTIRTWEVHQSRRLSAIAVPKTVHELAFTSDGASLVALDCQGQLQLWDAEHRESRFLFPGDFVPGSFVTLPGQARLVTANRAGQVDFWDLSPGEPTLLPAPISTRALWLAVSADGRRLVCAGNHPPIELWDLETGARIAQWQERSEISDGRLLLSDRGEVFLTERTSDVEWRILHVNDCRTFATSESLPSAIAPRRSAIFLGDSLGGISEWSLSSATRVRGFWKDGGWISCLALSPDERILAAGSGGTVRLWDLETGWELFSSDVAADGERSYSMAFSPDGTVLAISTGTGDGRRGHLIFWNARPAIGSDSD